MREVRYRSRDRARRRVGRRPAITSILALLTVWVVAACGSSSSSSTSSGGTTSRDGTTPTAAAAAVKGKHIAIVMPESVPGYAKQIGCGAYLEGKRLGADVGQPQAPAGQDSAPQQAQVIQAALATNPAGLIFDPADAKADAPPIKTAVAGGLPVVDVDTQLQDPSLYVSFVSSSHEIGGKLGGALLARQIGGSGEVAAIGIIPTNPITQGRILGFNEAMKMFPNIHVVTTIYPPAVSGNGISASVLTDAANALIAKYPNLKGIYTTNDTIASSVAAALRGSGKSPGQIKVVTWDLQPVGIKLLQEGIVTGTVVQRPREEGVMAMDQLANKLEGKPTTKRLIAPLSTTTSTQINTPAIKALYYSNAC